MEVKEADSQTPPSLENTLPLHLLTPQNRLANEAQGSNSPTCLPALPLRMYLCLNKLSLYFLNLSAYGRGNTLTETTHPGQAP